MGDDMKECIKKVVICFVIMYITVFTIFNTASVQICISSALERCILTVIPSLYAMMAVSGILVRSNILNVLAKIINPFARLIGMNGNILIILLISMIAGYPVGARMISEEFEKGSITKKQAEYYIAVCFGAGPSFIFGCVADMLFSGSNAGIIILVSTVSVNIAMGIILSFFLKNKTNNKCSLNVNFTSEILTESAISGGKNMFGICVMILFFSIFTCIMEQTGIIYNISNMISELTGIEISNCSGMIKSILEVTNLGMLEKGNYSLLPFVCFAVSFGGVCVILQIKTVLNKELNLNKFIVIRLVCAVISGIVCYKILPFMLKNQTISVSTEYHIYSSESPIPSYMLIIMIVILMSRCRFSRR